HPATPKVCSHRHRLAGITVTSCLQLKRNWLDCQPKKDRNSALRWRNPCSGLFGAGWKSWNGSLWSEICKRLCSMPDIRIPTWSYNCLTPGINFQLPYTYTTIDPL